MFLILLEYKKPIDEVEKHLQEHRDFLAKYYEKGIFFCAGRKNPRTGGVIFATNVTRDELEVIMQEDAFYTHDVAEYEFVDVSVTSCIDALKGIVK